jgi:hypothetical protein
MLQQGRWQLKKRSESAQEHDVSKAMQGVARHQSTMHSREVQERFLGSETTSELQRTQVDSTSATWREAHRIAVAVRRGVQSFPLQDPQARQTRRLALQGWGDIIKI